MLAAVPGCRPVESLRYRLAKQPTPPISEKKADPGWSVTAKIAPWTEREKPDCARLCSVFEPNPKDHSPGLDYFLSGKQSGNRRRGKSRLALTCSRETKALINTNRRTYYVELSATPSNYMASVSWAYLAGLDHLVSLPRPALSG